jgi:hypothetical protein
VLLFETKEFEIEVLIDVIEDGVFKLAVVVFLKGLLS